MLPDADEPTYLERLTARQERLLEAIASDVHDVRGIVRALAWVVVASFVFSIVVGLVVASR